MWWAERVPFLRPAVTFGFRATLDAAGGEWGIREGGPEIYICVCICSGYNYTLWVQLDGEIVWGSRTKFCVGNLRDGEL